jgi:hypothetical protein
LQGDKLRSLLSSVASVTLSVGSLAAALSNDDGSQELPLLEAALTNIAASAKLQGSLLSSSVAAVAAANAYSTQHGGWEPAVEPWHFSLEGSTVLTRCASCLACMPMWARMPWELVQLI